LHSKFSFHEEKNGSLHRKSLFLVSPSEVKLETIDSSTNDSNDDAIIGDEIVFVRCAVEEVAPKPLITISWQQGYKAVFPFSPLLLH